MQKERSDAGRYQASRRVTIVSILTNLVLSFGQMIIGLIGNSQALVADGFHTLSDLITDVLILFGAKHGAKDADEDHPYGHARIETAVTVALSAILLAAGIGIAINAGLRLSRGAAFIAPTAATLGVAVFTLIAKESLYRYTLRVAKQWRSNLLHGAAWHHRSDAFSSVIVAVGIAGSLAGIRYLDAVAAIGVGLLIAKMGANLGWQATRELVDTGLDAEQLRDIRRTILSVSGVKTLHLLRTRRVGGQALVDVHIIVDGTLSVSEGHQISETVRAKLIDQMDSIADVMVHIDPEDDETSAPNSALPLRDVVLTQLQHCFKDIEAAKYIENIALHYLNGRIRVELLLPLQLIADRVQARKIVEQFQAGIKENKQFYSLDVRFH